MKSNDIDLVREACICLQNLLIGARGHQIDFVVGHNTIEHLLECLDRISEAKSLMSCLYALQGILERYKMKEKEIGDNISSLNKMTGITTYGGASGA